jgi:hypothetical protein
MTIRMRWRFPAGGAFGPFEDADRSCFDRKRDRAPAGLRGELRSEHDVGPIVRRSERVGREKPGRVSAAAGINAIARWMARQLTAAHRTGEGVVAARTFSCYRIQAQLRTKAG